MKNLPFGQVQKYLSSNNNNAPVEVTDNKGITEFKVNGKLVLSAPTSAGKINEMTVRGAVRSVARLMAATA